MAVTKTRVALADTNKQSADYVREKFDLTQEEVGPHYKKPFVLRGYRYHHLGLVECLRSCFLLHNETLNVWTHLIASVAFIVMSIQLFLKEGISDSYAWPLLSYSVGRCFHFLASAGAHALCAISPRVHHTCFFVDYAGVAIFTIPAGQSYLFYLRPLSPELFIFKYPEVFLLFSTAVSTLTTVLVGLSRFKWHSYRYFIRSFTFIVPFVIHSLPYLYRIVACSSKIDCEFSALAPFTRQLLWYLLAVLITASHVPERLFPGRFDYIGYSHSVMHVVVALGAYEQFNAVLIDFQTRRDLLSGQEITLWNSVGLFCFSSILNVIIALYLGNLIEVDESHKHKKEQ